MPRLVARGRRIGGRPREVSPLPLPSTCTAHERGSHCSLCQLPSSTRTRDRGGGGERTMGARLTHSTSAEKNSRSRSSPPPAARNRSMAEKGDHREKLSLLVLYPRPPHRSQPHQGINDQLKKFSDSGA